MSRVTSGTKRAGSFLFIVCAVFVIAQAALAQQRQRRPQQPQAGEWVQLFNGKDLTNWVKIGNEKWAVEDGTIYGEGISEKYGYLVTEKNYIDFDFSLRFKCEANGNSGVYLRTRFTPGTVDVSEGYQVEIDRTLNHHTGGVYGDGRGWMAWPAPEYETVVRPNDWNEMLIEVTGNRTIVHLNGIQVLDYTNPNPKSTDGVIGLQLHSGGEGKMRFKDIYVRDRSVRPNPQPAAGQ